MANHEYPFVSEGAFFISRDVIPFLNLYCAKQTDMEIITLPSTSPANAAYSLQNLLQAWSVIRTYLQD